MNLESFKSSWKQYVLLNSLEDIPEDEICSVIDAPKTASKNTLSKRLIQNVFIFSFLILCINGGCSF